MNETTYDYTQQFDVRVFASIKEGQVCAVLQDVANNKEIASFERLVGGETDEFSSALADFKAFCGDYPVWVFDKDQEILERSCKDCSVDFSFRHPFICAKALLAEAQPGDYPNGQPYKIAGTTADALYDARKLAAVVSHYENREVF